MKPSHAGPRLFERIGDVLTRAMKGELKRGVRALVRMISPIGLDLLALALRVEWQHSSLPPTTFSNQHSSYCKQGDEVVLLLNRIENALTAIYFT